MGTIKLLAVLDPVESLNPRSSRRALSEMLRDLSKNRWEVHLLHGRQVRYESFPCKYIVHVVPFGSRPRSPIFKLLYLIAALFVGVRAVKKCGIHITFCKGGHIYLGLVAFFIARLTGRKCLIRVNEDAVLMLELFLRRAGIPRIVVRPLALACRILERYMLSKTSWVVTHGPMDYERLRRWGLKRLSFVPLGVDTKLFKPMPEEAKRFKQKLLGNARKRVVLYVGRLSPVKDVPTLFKAFKALLEERDDLVLVVVGSGVDEERLRRLAIELGIAHAVRFLGFISNERLPAYYNIANVYVLPSLYEEWSNTIMEAMACGTPVVATNVGGNPHLIRDGETGFLVPPRRPDLLAERIRLLLKDEELAKRIRERARQEVKKYDIRASARAYKNIMIKLVRTCRTSR